MARLARSVFVRDPDKHQDILLRAGETPAPQYAVLVKNPACWEGGKLPAAVKKADAADTKPAEPEPEGDDDADNKPAARKTAVRKPARGRTTAAEGTSGQ